METKSSGNPCSSGTNEARRCYVARRSAFWCLILVTSTLELCKVLPASTRSAIVSSSSANPCPVNLDVVTIGASGHRSRGASRSSCCTQSALLTTTTTCLLVPVPTTPVPIPTPIVRNSSQTSRSWLVSFSDPSKTSSTTSALSAAARLRCTPICSTGSSLGVIPAVSIRCNGIPCRLATSSTVDRKSVV